MIRAGISFSNFSILFWGTGIWMFQLSEFTVHGPVVGARKNGTSYVRLIDPLQRRKGPILQNPQKEVRDRIN